MSTAVVWVLRRLVVAPAVIALTVVLWVTLPVWLLGAAALSPVLPGRWRALRLLWVVIVYLSFETLLLAVMLGLWLASGFGWRIRSPYFAGIHYDLVQGTLIVFFREARRVLALRIRTDGPHPARHPDRPVLVMCRHAGPGDSFILMYALLHWYHREPRVVLKNTLAWDPAIDVVLRRIPARFISPDPEVGRGPRVADRRARHRPRPQRRVRDLPRGRQLHRRRAADRAIARLRKLGLERMAVRAEEMTHVLAPRPGGVLAALEAAPDADVLDGRPHRARPPRHGERPVALAADGQADHHAVVAGPRAEIPEGRDERIEWLYGWWERVDDWIEENRVDPERCPTRSRPDRRAVAQPRFRRTERGWTTARAVVRVD